MNYLLKSFLRGLLVLVPIVGTAYIVYLVVTVVDRALGVPIPGLGLLMTFLVVTGVGAMSGNFVGRRFVRGIDQLFNRLPVVKLLYSSLRDLLSAFVGDQKRFDAPVMVDLLGNGTVKVFGFVTCRHFDDPKLKGYVSVYLPQSYNFAGNMIVVEEQRVYDIDADSAEFMAFIVSGGVAEMNAARTFMESQPPAAPSPS